MKTPELIKEIVATYERHGWKLRRVLLRSVTRAEINDQAGELLKEKVVDADFNALWFARPSHRGREAWELRLIAEQPYGLFEAFKPEQSEEDREEARKGMEDRMREYLRR